MKRFRYFSGLATPRTLLRTVFVVALVGVVLTAGRAHAGYSEGVQAYEAARFQDAIREFRSLVVRGHAGAEFMMGVMYFQGQGLVRNQSIAAIWFYKAALKGHAGAQLAFGSMHVRGIGVYQNLSKAYKWLTLAAESGVTELAQKAGDLRKDTALLMTQKEIDEAVADARGFTPIKAGIVRE